ncbi:MAG: hypothetical protein ACP5HG_06795 [Anaerolineae bacterium]
MTRRSAEETSHPRRVLLLLAVPLAGAALWGGLRVGGYMAGAARWRHVPLPAGSIPVPQARTLEWRASSALTDDLLEGWAAQPLPDWQEEGKVTAPRVLLAKLALNRDLDAANAYLQAQVPWGRSGSTWELHPEGDYDFTLAGLTVMLWLFGDDPEVLYPATRTHLLETLLVEEGDNFRVSVPRSLGLVRDTENHLLMTEGSRYLKNRWLWLHGSTAPRHDNDGNGMEARLLDLLGELQTAGLYEFNSIPYMGYTLTALMNLEAFGSDAVRAAAGEVLDRANWAYALGSLDFRRFAPFRRQMRRADLTGLDADPHTALIRAWMSYHPDAVDIPAITEGRHHALWAALLPYRLPDETARWILAKPSRYFVRFGHGPRSSPELYAGGPGYLLSAGGVHRGPRSMVVARPITLMLDDGAHDLSEVLHMAGPGEDFTRWNNTGVHRDFAVAAGPVRMPASWRPVTSDAIWDVYAPIEGIAVAVHSRPELGVVAIFRSDNVEHVLMAVSTANPDAEALVRTFQWPGGPTLTYDVQAPRNRWVITAVNGDPVDRAFDAWAQIDGEILAEGP